MLTKTRWAGIFPMPHTSVMPHSGAELKRLGTLIKWNTKEAALLSTLHQGIVRLVEQVGISGIREIANSARMTDRRARSRNESSPFVTMPPPDRGTVVLPKSIAASV